MASDIRQTERFAFTLNGREVTFEGDPSMPLLWFLRDTLALTGTKFGCGVAMCGACTVHVDGAATRSCVLPVDAVRGMSVTTIEGVADTAVGRAVQEAWVDLNVVQCGYCQSGQIMSASALLSDKHAPTDADIDAAMSGNICRCATYLRIKAAIHQAAKALG
ncbi:(2Fe-2S)-binding protein [Xanthobacter sp. VNH20]|uniref:(2Fe-2S)-binding protein n=1 Tax=Xanthobacter sp. VNH20 TaxID=3156616 RepID=UPI0032B58D1C